MSGGLPASPPVELNPMQREGFDSLVAPYLDGRNDGTEWAHIDNARGDELRYALQAAVLALVAARDTDETTLRTRIAEQIRATPVRTSHEAVGMEIAARIAEGAGS